MPRVSVIMPVYNGGEAVAQAVHSVLAQTFTDFELIISDDGSTDGCLDFCEKLSDRRVRLLTGVKNTGAAGARNHALAVAEAPLVAIADADDLVHPLRLQKQVAFLDEYPSVDLVAGATCVFGSRSAGRISRPVTSHVGLVLGLRYGPSFFHGTVMVRTAAVRSIGGYRDLPPAEDYDMYSRLLLGGYRFSAIPDVVLFYRDHGGGISKLKAAEGARLHQSTSKTLRENVGVPRLGELVRAAMAERRADGPDPRLRMLKLLGRTALEMRKRKVSSAFVCVFAALLMGPRSWFDLGISTVRRSG